ncbi:MAG: GAF domain-containing protein [Proteobacteria bacterium]|nr:GAF domain-containing protein [Pseudomonadota bacterium]MBU1715277.1 GAF domain-containing protein [Pseudomonadota bacterium]
MTARKQSEMLADSMHRNAALVAVNLAERCAYHLVLNDYAGLEGLLLQTADSADIKRLRVSEPNGFLLGDVVSAPDGKTQRGQLGENITPPASFTTDFLIEGDELIVWQPITAGAPLGWLQATYDLSPIRAAKAETLKKALLFSLFWVICSVGLLLLFLQPLVRAINKLTVFAGCLNEHKGERVAIRQGTREIIELADSLNDASLRLLASERRMVEDRERLRQSEEKFRSLIQKVQAAILVHDGKGGVLDSNPLARKLLGLSEEQLMDKERIDPAWRFLREDGSAMPVEEYPVSRVLSSGQPLRDYVVGIHAPSHDHISWMLVNGEPEYDEERSIRQVIVSFIDITERKWAENLAQARLRLLEKVSSPDIPMAELLQRMLDEIETQTASSIGFYHFVKEDQQTLSLQSWSTNTLSAMCTAEGKGRHYPVEEAGVWADCVRQCRPVVHNDYASLPHRKGMPEGHARISRELVIPVFREGQIVAVIGVGNKPDEYTESDIQLTSLLGDFSWEIVTRKQAEGEIRKLNAELEERVRLRTAELAAKNEELERMNQLFVGRELKMVELKKKIQELERESPHA